MKRQEYIGLGSINQLSSIMSKLFAKKVFLVTGKDSYRVCGAENYLNCILADYEICRFSDFSNNPMVEDVTRGIELFKQSRSDVVIAVGGGSIIDMAKLINFFAGNDMTPSEYISSRKKSVRKGKPLIAIPTTAGTGSETTQFAVLYIDKKKFSLDNESILPDVAIIDPNLTMSLPRYITATTGMDALGQAIESYWSINSNTESKALAKRAIELVAENLATAANRPTASARLAMAEAASLAGKAINITRTTACHSISYPLTSYFGITHGHAVGLTLPSMLEYISGVSSSDVADTRGYKYVRRSVDEIVLMLGAKNISEAKGKIIRLMETIGLQTRLNGLGIKSEEDIENIVENGFNPERVRNNPRVLTRKALREILYSIYF